MTERIPAVMRAVRLHPPGGPTQLGVEQMATPRPAAGEALVRVHAAAITRDELDWPTDRLPAIPSYEFSGVVAAVAGDVEEPPVGTAVYALGDFDRDGAAADYTVVPAGVLAPKPATLGHLESAAVPLAALSAWQALFDQAASGRASGCWSTADHPHAPGQPLALPVGSPRRPPRRTRRPRGGSPRSTSW
jgi:NADPH:quinone reductase-like Zn-dependent oxidoreductase